MPTPNLNEDDYYKILGCNRSANESELKKAYRKLAVKVSACMCLQLLLLNINMANQLVKRS